jgi:hypothetical protein
LVEILVEFENSWS